MKKLVIAIMALTLSANITAYAGDSSVNAQATTAPITAVPENAGYTLNYDEIALWVNAGFIGVDETGSPVVMAIDAANQNAIIIFGDNSNMTAASFVGPVIYSDTQAVITDAANGMSLTFSVLPLSENTLMLDMGDVGKAAITAATKEDVLTTLKLAIENYKHII